MKQSKNFTLLIAAILSLLLIVIIVANKKESADTPIIEETTVETTTIVETTTEVISIPEDELVEFEKKITDYKAKINGVEISFPIKVSDFLEKTKLTITEEDKNTILKTNEYKTIVASNEDIDLSITILNDSDKEDTKFEDYLIFKIGCSATNIKNVEKQPIVLPKSVQINVTTRNELIEKYGKPSKIEEDENSKYTYMEWDMSDLKHDEYSFLKVTIDKEKDLLYEFAYSKSPLM